MDETAFEARLQELENARDLEGARSELVELVADASQAGSPRVAAGAAVTLAIYYDCVGEHDAAVEMRLRASSELAGVVAPVERARLALAHAYAVFDRYPDEAPLREALPVLEGAGRWGDASGTAALLAEAAARDGRIEAARHYFARAIGAAGLGDAARAQHRVEEARTHYQDALDRLTNLQAGGSDRIRTKLRDLG